MLTSIMQPATLETSNKWRHRYFTQTARIYIYRTSPDKRWPWQDSSKRKEEVDNQFMLTTWESTSSSLTKMERSRCQNGCNRRLLCLLWSNSSCLVLVVNKMNKAASCIWCFSTWTWPLVTSSCRTCCLSILARSYPQTLQSKKYHIEVRAHNPPIRVQFLSDFCFLDHYACPQKPHNEISFLHMHFICFWYHFSFALSFPCMLCFLYGLQFRTSLSVSTK